MKASAIQRRDVMGPRKPKIKESIVKTEIIEEVPKLIMSSNPSSTGSMSEGMEIGDFPLKIKRKVSKIRF